MTPVCLVQSHGDIITPGLAANCRAAKMYKCFIQQWTIQAYQTLTNSDHVMAQGTDICQQCLSLQEWSTAAQESLMLVHWNPWHVLIPIQWTHLLYQVCVTVGRPDIHYQAYPNPSYPFGDKWNRKRLWTKQLTTMQQIFLHTRSHVNVPLYHTVMNAVLANSESYAVSILHMAMLGFHYLELHRWEASLFHFPHCNNCVTQPIYGKVGGGQTNGNKFFCVTRGSNGVWLIHKCRNIMQSLPSHPLHHRISNVHNSLTYFQPLHIILSVCPHHTASMCRLFKRKLSALLLVTLVIYFLCFNKHLLFRSDNIHGFQLILLNFTDYSWCPVSHYASKRYGNWHCGYVDQTH
jgi:hypothetical protein